MRDSGIKFDYLVGCLSYFSSICDKDARDDDPHPLNFRCELCPGPRPAFKSAKASASHQRAKHGCRSEMCFYAMSLAHALLAALVSILDYGYLLIMWMSDALGAVISFCMVVIQSYRSQKSINLICQIVLIVATLVVQGILTQSPWDLAKSSEEFPHNLNDVFQIVQLRFLYLVSHSNHRDA